MFDHLLQSSGTMLVQGDADKVARCLLDEHSTLLVIAVLQKLLAEVVAEGISHEFDDMLVGLEPDHVHFLGLALLELLLKVATSVLVLAERVDLASVLLQGDILEAAHGCYIVLAKFIIVHRISQ